MIREIVLTDFMSHRHTVIEPAAGLTVLVGPNNCGKSAVVAALQILSANSRKDYMIRHGCRECAVTVKTDDGHTITWRRKGKIVNYTIDGQDVHRLEGDIPEGLHDLLKLALVESVEGNESFDVHFARQKDPIFLLNGTGRQAATFFASSSDAARLVAMQQRHREKVREQSHAEKAAVGQVDELKLKLQALTPVPDLQVAMDDAASAYHQLQNQAAGVVTFEGRIHLLAVHASALELINARCHAMTSLTPPPPLSDTRTLEKLIKNMATIGDQVVSINASRAVLMQLLAPPELAEFEGLERLCRDLARERSTEQEECTRTQALRELAAPPLLAETVELERLCQNISQESATLTAGKSMTNALQYLSAPPDLQNIAPLETNIEALETSINAIAQRAAQVEVLSKVDAPPSLFVDSALIQAIEEYETIQCLLHSHQHDVDLLEQAIQSIRGEISQWTQAHPTCPTCGSLIDADQFLLGAEVHSHG